MGGWHELQLDTSEIWACQITTRQISLHEFEGNSQGNIEIIKPNKILSFSRKTAHQLASNCSLIESARASICDH